jgi:hypothetical protein
MYKEKITVDVERLRKDMKNECMGAFYGGRFGGALMESFDVDRASSERLVEIAKSRGVDLRKYEIDGGR